MRNAADRTDISPIRIRGARQNNLRNLDLDIEPGTMTVIKIGRASCRERV